ncbi:transposase [Chitinophaga sp.]|uniref:transposase n=1 Tax=Chitinophaga sp. TaxID=1869181 RepID=UPI0031E22ECC
MNTINYQRANLWLFLAVSAYFLMNGAGLWETFVLIPRWTLAPPASLHFLQGPYALNLGAFWIGMHSFHEVLFIACIVFNWRIKRRRNLLLALFAGHMALRVWTLLYFAPAIGWFQALPPSDAVDAALQAKAAAWRNLNLVRTGLYCVLNLVMAALLPFKQPS